MLHHPSSFRSASRSRLRRGQALIEFAFVSVFSVMLVTGLMAVLVMALGSFQNNIATESAGRQLDGHPLFIKENFFTHFTMDPDDPDPFYMDDDFENVTARQVYRFLNEYPDPVDGRVLYDERWLILSEDEWDDRNDLPLPAINRSLLGQYIFDPDLVVEGQQGGFRFPGAVVTNTRTGNRTVLVPLLPGRNSSGIGRTFNITSTHPDFFYPVSQNWVAPVVIGKDQNGDGIDFRVIMFHPSQPAALQYNENQLVEANDGAVADAIGGLPQGYALEDPQPINPEFDGSSTSRGQFGLGELGIGGGTIGPDGSTPAIPPRKIRPFRMVFETASLFRIDESPSTVKYQAAGTSIRLKDGSDITPTMDASVHPFVTYEHLPDQGDQSLGFEWQVVDRFSIGLRRYFVDLPINPPASADNDFVKNVLQLLPNDDGVWRVSVAADFEASDGQGWKAGHVLQLRLYKNGVRERLIVTHNVTTAHAERISITGQAIIKAQQGDVLQVRVATIAPADSVASVDSVDPVDPGDEATGTGVQLTGVPALNWVSFERIGD